MRRLLRRGLKLTVPAAIVLSMVPAGRADGATGVCGYVGVGSIDVTLVTFCTPAQCAGLALPPISTGVGGVEIEEFVCVMV
jgi:hypothetical protein